MINIKFIAVSLVFFISALTVSKVQGQDHELFANRLDEIERQLDLLSDSVAPGLNEMANFSVADLPIQTFLRTLAENHDLNIQVDPSLSVSLTNNFTSVQVKNIILFVCQEYQLDIRFINAIMSFVKFRPPAKIEPVRLAKKLSIAYDVPTGRISFDLAQDSLRAVVKQITKISDRNVMVAMGPELENKMVSGFIKDAPLESALDKLAYTNNLKLSRSKDGILILESNLIPTQSGGMSQITQLPAQRVLASGDIVVKDSLIFLDISNFPIMEAINQVSSQLGINYIMFSELTGNTTAKVKGVRYQDFLTLLFQGTNFTYKKKDGVYLIGQRAQEGFRVTEVVKLDFRTIEGMEKEIPSDLLKDVELKILKELNSFIVTGNKQKIDEIVSFIKLIDQPIPNILIEVIVAEAQKSFSIQTGIKGFISSDSIPKTGGQVFPGLDLTLSSKSINGILDKLDTKGIVNVGRVTPDFYTTIQALETNNNIQIRSTPKLSTMNGSKANLVIGESQYYVEQTQNITGGVSPITSTTQRFNKVEANLALTISPVVSGNEHITLDIVAEFSNFSAPTILNAPPGNKTRKFESKIRIRNEEVIILGGLEQLSKTEVGSGLPWISRVPVLKWFFSSKTKKKDDSRLIVFIRPTLVY